MDGEITAAKRSEVIYAEVVTLTASTGVQTINTVPFRPKAVLAIEMNSTNGTNLTFGFGYADTTMQTVQSVGATASAQQRSREVALVCMRGGGAVVEQQATVTAFNSNGITLNKSIANSTRPVLFIFIA